MKNKNINEMLSLLLNNLNIKIPQNLELNLTSNGPCVNSPLHIGEASATALLAHAILISKIFNIRTSQNISQSININLNDAALSTLRCSYMKQNNYFIPFPDIEYPTVNLYKTKDNRYIFINGGFPALKRGLLSFFNCADNVKSLQNEILKWNSFSLEKALQDKNLCAAVFRTPTEWKNSVHGKEMLKSISKNNIINPIKIEEICKGPIQKLIKINKNEQPLSNIKILDLTHVLAGPTSTMMLAEQGAHVMRINGPQIPTILPFVMDTSHGKLNAQLDLKTNKGKEMFWKLIDESDIIVQSYRPNKISELGFSPKTITKRLKKLNKNIIYVSINCYGYIGPWKNFPGWEQLAQAATGLGCIQGTNEKPEMLPTFPNDYITGYLATSGILAALIKRHEKGGSYHVKLSLSASSLWLQQFGLYSKDLLKQFEFNYNLNPKLSIENLHTGYGKLQYFGHPIKYSITKSHWNLPTVPIGFNEAKWPNSTN